MTCKEQAEVVTAYLEGELPLLTRVGIWLHLQMCAPCRRYFKQIGEVAKATGRVPELEMPPEVRDSMSGVLARAAEMRAEQKSAAAPESDSA